MKLVAIILAIDPGLSVGHCLLKVFKEETKGEFASSDVIQTHDYIDGYGIHTVDVGTFKVDDCGNAQKLDVIMQHAHNYDQTVPVFLICEHFTITLNTLKGGGRYAIEMIGMIKMLIATKYPLFRLDTTQKPSDAKPNIKNDKLMAMKIKRRGDKQEDHALDAARHAILAVSRIRTAGSLKGLRDEFQYNPLVVVRRNEILKLYV